MEVDMGHRRGERDMTGMRLLSKTEKLYRDGLP
jgi:hypothetical protein